MVYRNYHECEMDCKSLFAYVRIDGIWTIIGKYGSECKKFDPFDKKAKEQDRKINQRVAELIQKSKQISRESKITRHKESNVIPNLFGIDIRSFCTLDDDVDS